MIRHSPPRWLARGAKNRRDAAGLRAAPMAVQSVVTTRAKEEGRLTPSLVRMLRVTRPRRSRLLIAPQEEDA